MIGGMNKELNDILKQMHKYKVKSIKLKTETIDLETEIEDFVNVGKKKKVEELSTDEIQDALKKMSTQGDETDEDLLYYSAE